jgi:hypothetical protein
VSRAEHGEQSLVKYFHRPFRCLQLVHGSPGDHQQDKRHEYDARPYARDGAHVQTDMPEACDTQTRGEGADQAARNQS